MKKVVLMIIPALICGVVFTSCGSNVLLTESPKSTSTNFADHQGQLPWPTEKGVITGHYGKQTHPNFTGVTVDNKGVYIQTPAQSNARSVFDGTVIQNVSLIEDNYAILVLHDEYITVYANLTEVYVKAGDKIKAKQAVGKIHTDADNKTELNFQIWKGTNPLNPEEWLVN